MKCPQCGKEIDDASKFCPYCGANLDGQHEVIKPEVVSSSTEQGSAKKSSAGSSKHSPAWILALLSIIFGAIGSGVVGVILGIIALCEKPTEDEKTMAIVGIVVSAALSWVWWVFKKW
jgi:uncharacterized membrane protein YvbJ